MARIEEFPPSAEGSAPSGWVGDDKKKTRAGNPGLVAPSGLLAPDGFLHYIYRNTWNVV